MTALIDIFKKTLADLHAGGGPVLAAVSGGADSMALLHLLHRAGIPCGAAYFDHQTRQGASAEDGHFVASAARALGLPFHLGGGDVAALAAERGESFEMAARRARYGFLVETARSSGYAAMATGHHADDQAETVLLRLLRGASPAGLAGIPPVRMEGGLPIVRPLLPFARAEIGAWLVAEGIAWREDASNAETDALRNRVRHQLLPLLARDFNPGITEALNRLAQLQRMDHGLLESLAATARRDCEDGAGRVGRSTFRALNPALQYRCMASWIRSGGGVQDFENVSRAAHFACHGESGKQLDLGNATALYLSAEHAVFAPLNAGAEPRELPLPLPGEAQGFGRHFHARCLAALPAESLSTYCHVGRQVFDADAVAGGIIIRRRRHGDLFRPLGMSGKKKLKDIYNDRGLTRPERAREIVVESGGRILWIPGYTVSQDGAVTEGTAHFLEICIEGPELCGE